jgi:hypothetical protein
LPIQLSKKEVDFENGNAIKSKKDEVENFRKIHQRFENL